MKNTIVVLSAVLVISFLISGCSKNRSAKLIGNVYTFQDDSLRFVAGFDQDSLFYTVKDMMNESLKVAFHKSKYKINQVNDSDYIVILETKPRFWETNTWEIVIDNNGRGLYSANSKRYFKLTDDKNVLK